MKKREATRPQSLASSACVTGGELGAKRKKSLVVDGKIKRMKLSLHHNFYHYLFVASASLLVDGSAFVLGVIIGILGLFIFTNIEVGFYRIVVAFPLIIIGVSIALINLTGIIDSIFSTQYSFSHCPFCNKTL